MFSVSFFFLWLIWVAPIVFQFRQIWIPFQVDCIFGFKYVRLVLMSKWSAQLNFYYAYTEKLTTPDWNRNDLPKKIWNIAGQRTFSCIKWRYLLDTHFLVYLKNDETSSCSNNGLDFTNRLKRPSASNMKCLFLIESFKPFNCCGRFSITHQSLSIRFVSIVLKTVFPTFAAFIR